MLFSLFFGVAASQYVRDTGNTIVIDWILAINEIIVNIIKNVMKISPIGIFCLLADVTGSKGFTVVIPMAKFLAILIIGDILQLVIYGLITAAICRVNPMKMPKKFAKMSIIALTTTSSAISASVPGPEAESGPEAKPEPLPVEPLPTSEAEAPVATEMPQELSPDLQNLISAEVDRLLAAKLAEIENNLDKKAAAAAAKVIREEIEALASGL